MRNVLVAITLLLAGCSTPAHIALSSRQQVVMESSVLAAGVVAGTPTITAEPGGKRATVWLSNDHTAPAALHYRFYWYDKQGLELLPLQPIQTLLLSPDAHLPVDSLNSNLDAHSVRLYVYL